MKLRAICLVLVFLITWSAWSKDGDIIQNLSSQDVKQRFAAVRTICEKGKTTAGTMKALMTAYSEADRDADIPPNDELRDAIIIAFGTIGSEAKDALPLLTDLVRISNSVIAADAIIKIDPKKGTEIQEMLGIGLCQSIAEAQYTFKLADKSGKKAFARTVTELSNMSLVSSRQAEAEKSGKSIPFGGYLFRMLTNQHADGFIAIAYPAEFSKFRMRTFIIGDHEGTPRLYGKDLGLDTNALIETIMESPPDATWKFLGGLARGPIGDGKAAPKKRN